MRPVTDDVDTGGFFRHAAIGELAVARCGACDALLHPPTGMCPACGATDVVWRVVAPTGRLATWTVVERQVNDAFPTPYTVVLVDLDDEPAARVVGHLPGRPHLFPGQAMVATFAADDGAAVPSWRPADASAPPARPTDETIGDGS